MAAMYGNPSPLPSPIVTNTKDGDYRKFADSSIYYAFDRWTDPDTGSDDDLHFNIPIERPELQRRHRRFHDQADLRPGRPRQRDHHRWHDRRRPLLGTDTNAEWSRKLRSMVRILPRCAPSRSIFSVPGLILRAANCTIKGLTIQNFNESGIFIFQGSDPNGSPTTGNVIGGPRPAARNVISGNARTGIGMRDSTTTGNTI